MTEVRFRYAREDLLRAVADRKGLSLTMLLRSLADSALASEGFPVGEREWALVANGTVRLITRGAKPDLADSSHHPAGYSPVDGDVWLPIVNADSESFDTAQHYRLPPLPLRVDGERVVRVYPVVPKSWEHA